MKETTYIFNSGTLKRENNSLVFEYEDGKKHIPIENIKEIFVFGELNINKRLLEFLANKEILLSFFNHYGYYIGSFYPREHYNSGYMILKQADFYNKNEERLKLAKKFITGAIKNTLVVLKYYNRRGKNLTKAIEDIENILKGLDSKATIEESMSVEGQVKQKYYECFNEILKEEDFKFITRSKRPPKDYINTLISFSNSMIYTYILGEIYKTHLDPRIGYLHTTNFRRFSLNLDVAEIFKIVVGDRVIFSLINKRIINSKDFDKNMGGISLNDNGKRKFLEKMEEKLKQTIRHNTLKKDVSYRRLMRLELYKLEKHFIGEKEYSPFIMEW